MSFGRNPHVAKAELAEQKAKAARDDISREQAWRDAARQWERAADRETDDGRKELYSKNAESARAHAEGGTENEETSKSDSSSEKSRKLLN